MSRQTNWDRNVISIALIATGVFCLISNQAHGNSDFVALAAELSHLQSAQNAEPGNAPSFENAKVETRSLSGALSDEISRWSKSASDPQWLGYSIPAVNGERVICCGGNGDWNWNKGCGTCLLEDHQHGNNFTSSSSNKTQLEATRNVVVLYRASAGKLEKIRVVSDVCVIDAGGLHVTWLTGVNPAQSVEYLSGLVRGQDVHEGRWEKLPQGALTAIAMHADSSADKAMNSFVEPPQPESLRKQTVFWLGEARGASGFQTLKKVAKTETSTEVRSQITFALSLNHEAGALDEMIRMAREDEARTSAARRFSGLRKKPDKKPQVQLPARSKMIPTRK